MQAALSGLSANQYRLHIQKQQREMLTKLNRVFDAKLADLDIEAVDLVDMIKLLTLFKRKMLLILAYWLVHFV